jgi:low temperature requirement protein LtrA
MLVLALVWWAWSAFVWAANADDPASVTLRAVLLLATLLIFIAALALPQAYGTGSVIFAVAYAAVRLLHLALYADVSRRGQAAFRAIAGFSITVIVGMALLVAGALLRGPWLVILWTLAAAIDYAGPGLLTRRQLHALQQVAVEHFAERYSLFIIICLGESVVAIGVGAALRNLDATLIAGASLMLLVTVGLWWSYFGRLAAVAEERLRKNRAPVLAASDAYSYIHLLLVGGIIVFAAGARIAVAGIDHALPLAASLALGGGTALYLFGLFAFRWRITGTPAVPTAISIAAAALIALSGPFIPAWVEAGALVIVLTALAGWEARAAPA